MYCLVVVTQIDLVKKDETITFAYDLCHIFSSIRSHPLMPCFWLCQHTIMCPIICVKWEDVDVCHQVLIFVLLHSVTLINYICTFCPIFVSPIALMLLFLTWPCSQTLHAGTINVHLMLSCTVQETMQPFTRWKIVSHRKPSIWRFLGLKLQRFDTISVCF